MIREVWRHMTNSVSAHRDGRYTLKIYSEEPSARSSRTFQGSYDCQTNFDPASQTLMEDIEMTRHIIYTFNASSSHVAACPQGIHRTIPSSTEGEKDVRCLNKLMLRFVRGSDGIYCRIGISTVNWLC